MSLADNITMNLKFPKDFFKNYARDKPCLIRVAAAAGYQCNHEPGSVVLCHPSVAGIKAMGSRKASVPDIGGAWGCNVCHDLCDGRIKPKKDSPLDEVAGQGGFLKMVLQNALLEAVVRTIDALVKADVLPNP